MGGGIFRLLVQMLSEHSRTEVVHQGEGKPFLTKVFDAGSDVVDFIVDKQETVVRPVELLDTDGRILAVVALYIQLQLLTDMLEELTDFEAERVFIGGKEIG